MLLRTKEGAATIGEGYVQEEIARSLAQERDLWQREREAHAVATKREKGQLLIKNIACCV